MTKPITTAEKVDALIELKAQIKALEDEAAPLIEELKSFGPSVLAGTNGHVEISDVAGRKTTKWDLVVAAANVPQSIVDKYTTVGASSRRLNVHPKVV